MQIEGGSTGASGDAVVLIAVRWILVPAHDEFARLDPDSTREPFRLEHENPGRSDQYVVDVAVLSLDVIEKRPAAFEQRMQLPCCRLLTIETAAPPLDVSRRRVEQHHCSRRSGA